MPATQVSITKRTGRDGTTYRALRWQVDGVRQSETLGAVSQGTAEEKRQDLLAKLRLGLWQPTTDAGPDLTGRSTFAEFAVGAESYRTNPAPTGGWWGLNEGEWRQSTKQDYSWRLHFHLLPFFGDKPLDSITYNTVERFKAAKLREECATGRPLTPRSVNMFLTLLGQILEDAVEQELIPRNPAKGKKRRVKEPKLQRSYLESADQIETLLDAAGELDQRARGGQGEHIERRASLATLVFAGLRIGELTGLTWADVNLADGWIWVGESKTPAGVRKVKIRGALRSELLAARGRCLPAPPSAFVFPTGTGARTRAENYRKRVLKPAVALADRRRAGVDLDSLPERLTPHSLRRTFCSLLYALGETPPAVMRQMGHTDPKLALKVYEQSIEGDEGNKARLAALVDGTPLDAREVGGTQVARDLESEPS
jgi:integrase